MGWVVSGNSNYTVPLALVGAPGDKTDNYNSFAYEMVHRHHN